MRQLRHGKQRHEKHFPFPDFPISAEKPIFVVPHAAMPEQFFDVSQSPKRRQKYKPIRC